MQYDFTLNMVTLYQQGLIYADIGTIATSKLHVAALRSVDMVEYAQIKCQGSCVIKNNYDIGNH